MRIAAIILSVLLFTDSSALAQEVVWERFFPGEVGDYWEFSTRDEWCVVVETQDCNTTVGSKTFEVSERIETDGAVSITFYSDEGLCRLSIAEGEGWFTVEQLEGDACLPVDVPPGNLNFPQDQPLTPAEIEVRGQTYTVDALKWFGKYPFGGHRFAADIGMYKYFSQFWVEQSRYTSEWNLREARVEGVTYGVPVSSEPGADPVFSQLEVYPNPFRDHFALQTEQGNARIELFDVLGRRVLAEQLTLAGVVNTRDIAPGSYVLRLTQSDGSSSVQRVTKTR